MVLHERDQLYGVGRLVRDSGNQRVPVDGCAQRERNLWPQLHRSRGLGKSECDGHGHTGNHRLGHAHVERADGEHQRHERHPALRLYDLLRDQPGRPDAIRRRERRLDIDLHDQRPHGGNVVFRGRGGCGRRDAERHERHRLENHLAAKIERRATEAGEARRRATA